MTTPLFLALSALPQGADVEAAGWTAAFEIRVEAPASELVQVRAVLDGLDGPLELRLPERYAFAMAEDDRLVGALRARDAAGTEVATERLGPRAWSVADGAGTRVELEWTVRLDHRLQPDIAGRDEYEHPYLAADHGMLATAALLYLPDVDTEPTETTVAFRLPEGWAIVAPWERDEGGLFRPVGDELINDLVAVGAWDLERRSIDGLELTLAFAPGQAELRELVLEDTPAVLAEQVRLFGGPPQDRYLFLFGRPDQNSGYGGSPKTSAMTLFVSPNLPIDFVREHVPHLIAHEYHHTFQKANCEPADELRFVIEGFTDWAAYTVPWRLGLTDDASFKVQLENQFAKASTAAEAWPKSLVEAGGRAFFEGRPANDLCYAGGLLVAMWMDVQLRERGVEDGVDAFVRDLWGRPGEDREPDLERFAERVETALGPEAAERVVRLVRSEPPDLLELFASIDVEVQAEAVPLPPSPYANFEGTTVTVIDPQGAGARAGLRKGDRLISVNGQAVAGPGDAQRAWPEIVEGRLRITLERAGERLELDVEPPAGTEFRIPVRLLERLR